MRPVATRHRFQLLPGVPLAELTTLGVGGPARYVAECPDEEALGDCLAWARREGLAVAVLGGGSNLVAADGGWDGVVVRVGDGRIRAREDGGIARVTAGGGASWDGLVAWAVEEGLAGVEGLSGIPGRVGAAPVQNVGAYGQEVADVITAVRAVDRRTGEARRIPADECGFGYRASRFKGEWGERWVVTAVEIALRRGGKARVEYAELRARLGMGEGTPPPGLAEVRRAVIELRRGKSMVIDPGDPNRRSAGSFFVNPVVEGAVADAVRGWAGGDVPPPPHWPAGEGRVKLSAAWLIEAAGFPRGFAAGRVGLSTRHALAIVNRGGATAAEVVRLAVEIRRAVRERYGVVLRPEPVFLGFEGDGDAVLA